MKHPCSPLWNTIRIGCALLWSFASATHAAPLASFDFGQPSASEISLSPVIHNGQIREASSLQPGYINLSKSTATFGASGANALGISRGSAHISRNESEAIDNQRYLTFHLIPKEGSALTVDTIRFHANISSASDSANTVSVWAQIGNGSFFPLDSAVTITHIGGISPGGIYTLQLQGLEDVTQRITFRLLFYNESAAPATPWNGHTRIDDLTVEGELLRIPLIDFDFGTNAANFTLAPFYSNANITVPAITYTPDRIDVSRSSATFGESGPNAIYLSRNIPGAPTLSRNETEAMQGGRWLQIDIAPAAGTVLSIDTIRFYANISDSLKAAKSVSVWAKAGGAAEYESLGANVTVEHVGGTSSGELYTIPVRGLADIRENISLRLLFYNEDAAAGATWEGAIRIDDLLIYGHAFPAPLASFHFGKAPGALDFTPSLRNPHLTVPSIWHQNGHLDLSRSDSMLGQSGANSIAINRNLPGYPTLARSESEAAAGNRWIALQVSPWSGYSVSIDSVSFYANIDNAETSANAVSVWTRVGSVSEPYQPMDAKVKITNLGDNAPDGHYTLELPGLSGITEPIALRLMLYNEDAAAGATWSGYTRIDDLRLHGSVAEIHSAQWLDFDAGVSPVSRPLDALTWAPNGFISSSSVTSTLDLTPGGARWQVTGTGAWALLSFDIPEDAVPSVRGFRLRLNASAGDTLIAEFYEGFNTTRGFYVLPLIGTLQKPLKSGPQELLFYYADGGVPANKLGSVGGVRLITRGIPTDLLIEGIDLIFDSTSTAGNFANQQHNKLDTNLKTMQKWLNARGIQLPQPPSPSSGKTVLEAWETLGWQAAHLLAIKQQLDHWKDLSEAKMSSAAATLGQIAILNTERSRLVNRVKSGHNEASAINNLQAQTDTLINNCLLAIPHSQRRWTIGSDTRFYDPSGKPYRMFAPYFGRAIYAPGSGTDKLWRQWDMRYLAALGFNGIRLPVRWSHLEPVQGQFDPVFLGIIKDIIAEAERYGLGISFDLHWSYPDWFMAGKPGMQPATADIDSENSYHWTEALVDTWERLAAEVANLPNIVAFEVPTNETPVAKGPRGVLAYPTLMQSWNQWLNQTYGSRSALQTAWNNGDARYQLQSSENWTTHTIQPLGFQGDTDATMAYANNPRLWDHLRWVASLQQSVSTEVMDAIHMSIPDAIGIFQRTIGDVWDKSPVPLDYHSLQTLTGENVWPGTHYGMGGLHSRKARVFSLGTYDSEQQMENAQAMVVRHVNLGMGFCPFSFHARGNGGKLFSDDTWHLSASVLYLIEDSDWIRSHWPSPASGTTLSIAVIENTRLAATTKRTTISTILNPLLLRTDWKTDILEGMRVVRDPSLLENYDIVITESAYMDPALLNALDQYIDGAILIFGDLNRDSWARMGNYDIAARLGARGTLFNTHTAIHGLPAADPDDIGTIDLSGTYNWVFTGASTATPVWPPALPGGAEWSSMQVPSLWGEQDLLGTGDYLIGDAWYHKTVTIPANWSGRSLRLNIGAIDDYDWVFINGHLIGHTGAATANAANVRRSYTIPHSAINWGGANEIAICVRNINGDGGIWKAPVEIVSTQNWTLSEIPSIQTTSLSAGSIVPITTLHPHTEILEYFERHSMSTPAFLNHGRWYWWASDLTQTNNPDLHEFLIEWISDRLN